MNCTWNETVWIDLANNWLMENLHFNGKTYQGLSKSERGCKQLDCCFINCGASNFPRGRHNRIYKNSPADSWKGNPKLDMPIFSN